jgi:hypothetical protein
MATNNPTPDLITEFANVAAKVGAASTATDKFNTALGEASRLAQKYGGHIADVGKAVAALEAATIAFSSNEYKFLAPYAEAAKIPKLIAAEITNANIFALEQTDTLRRSFQEAAYKDQAELTKATIEVGKGVVLPLASFYENASKLGETYYQSALAESRLYNAALVAASSENAFELKKSAALTAKALGLDAREMTAIYQEEFSKTGKITGEFVNNFAQTVMAAEKVTGLNSKALSEDMQRMVTDVNTFGNATYAQMASLSNTIHQLGLDIDDVTKVATKFMSFENATQAISNLGAVTGATLDTMELFYLANEDKEEFFRSLKQQLVDQGVTLESLSHQEQVYLSNQLGFSNVRQLQTLLNDEIELTSENLSSLIEDTSKDQAYQGEELAKKLAQTGAFAKDTLEAIKPENLTRTLQQIDALAGGTNDVADAVLTLSGRLATSTTQAMPAYAAQGEAVGKAFGTAMKAAAGSIQRLDDFIDIFITTGGLQKIIKAIQTSPIYPSSIPKVWVPVLEGFGLFTAAFDSALDTQAKKMGKTTVSLAEGIKAGILTATAESDKSFESMIKLHKDKISLIEKTEKDVEAKIKSAGDEAQKVRDTIDIYEKAGYLKTEMGQKTLRDKLKDLYGDEKGLSETEVQAYATSVIGKDAVAQSRFVEELIAKRKTAGVEAIEGPGAQPVTPTTTKPGEDPTATPTATTAPVTARVTSGVNEEIKLNLRVMIDQDALAGLIKTEIENGIREGIPMQVGGSRQTLYINVSQEPAKA